MTSDWSSEAAQRRREAGTPAVGDVWPQTPERSLIWTGSGWARLLHTQSRWRAFADRELQHIAMAIEGAWRESVFAEEDRRAAGSQIWNELVDELQARDLQVPEPWPTEWSQEFTPAKCPRGPS